MVGFDKKDFNNLFYDAKIDALIEELKRRKLKLSDLQHNEILMNEITDYMVKQGLGRKEDIEIFIALDFAATFVPDDAQIFFVLKRNINPKNLQINTINDLIAVSEENTATDFAVNSKDGFRQFQLKQYQGDLETEKILEYVIKKLAGYGNDLGEVNLMVILQGDRKLAKPRAHDIKFKVIHDKLKAMGLNYEGQILLVYNEQNKVHVINQVYPELKTSRRGISEIDFGD